MCKFRYLTGVQGKPPSPYYDPLHQLITVAHERLIQVHAWLNPYIANRRPNWTGLASNHIANVYPQFAYRYEHYLWMDPGAEVVTDWITAVVKDIVNRSDFSRSYSVFHAGRGIARQETDGGISPQYNSKIF